jgi:hypothetical protein
LTFPEQKSDTSDHPKELIVQRKKARDQKIFMRFLMLSPKSQSYYQQIQQHRMNPHHHIVKIVALREICGTVAASSAVEDALFFRHSLVSTSQISWSSEPENSLNQEP